jgi:hypothetical protein
VKRFASAMLLCALAACSKNIQTKEALQAAIIDYLNERQSKTGLDVSKMDVNVTGMTFAADTARATVQFTLKTGEGGMQMGYLLDRKGNKWVVRGIDSSSAPAVLEPQQGAPNGTPPLPPLPGENGAPSGQLPAGHPPVGSKQ